jgi:hypothetical protein
MYWKYKYDMFPIVGVLDENRGGGKNKMIESE